VCVWFVDGFSDLLKLGLPLLGLRLQLCDAVLGVLQLTLEPPDHVVQGVEPWCSALLAGGCENLIGLATAHVVAPPQVLHGLGEALLVGLGPSVGASPEPSRGSNFFLARGHQEDLSATS
jgi:hypothetical protein